MKSKKCELIEVESRMAFTRGSEVGGTIGKILVKGYTISVTGGQYWSKNIKWKIPEINNKF